MKNLKKVLALVLAFACAFTMFAGAAFTDSADISQTEAVEMLSALGVIDGYDDGSFRPDATITRAEAAKMIYTIWNGGNDDASAFAGTSNFTDVYSGHWAEGYINFCYTNGIVAGKSTTSFAPDDSVTGVELAKMLLICMGYQADKSGLEGSTWSQNTNALASQNGLYDDVSTSVSAAMPRQYAAQIMYNALSANTVQWSSDSNAYTKVTTTGLEWRANADGSAGGSWVTVTKNETMGKKCMGLDTVENVQVRGVEKENGRDTYTVTTNLSTKFTRVAVDYTDLIGMNVNVMIKDDDYSKVYGMYVDEDCSVLATSVVGLLEADDSNTFKLADTSYDTDNDVDETPVYTINNDTSFNGAVTLDTVIASAATQGNKTDAYTIKLIDTDNDGDVNQAVVTPVYVTQVTYTNASSIRVDGGNLDSSVDTSYDYDDHTIADDIERDDWVVITDADYTVDGKAVITKADVVTGTVGATHTDSNGDTTEVRVDGTWYTAAGIVSDRTTAVGNKVELVVYGGMYFSVDGSAASLDVAAVTGVGNWDNMDGVLEVRLMFQDGSEEVVDVENWNGKTDQSDIEDEAAKDVLVTYDIDDDKYTLTTIPDDGSLITGTKYYGATYTSGMYDESRATIEAGSTYDIDDGAMIVIKNRDSDYIYMTGADLKNRNDITFTGTTYLVYDSDYEVVAMFASTDSTISSGTKQYGYIVELGREYIDGEYVLVIDVITADGLMEDVKTDQSNVGNFKQYDVISYVMNGDEMAITKESSDFYYGSIADYSSTRVRMASGDRYTLTDDTVIIAIENSGSSDADFAGTSLSKAVDADHINAIYIMDSDDEVAAIFVEVEADQDFGKTGLTSSDAKTQYNP